MWRERKGEDELQCGMDHWFLLGALSTHRSKGQVPAGYHVHSLHALSCHQHGSVECSSCLHGSTHLLILFNGLRIDETFFLVLLCY